MRHLLPILIILFSAQAFGQRVKDEAINAGSGSRYLETLPPDIIFYEGFENAERPHLPNGWTSLSLAPTGFNSGTAGDAPGQTNENDFWNVPKHGLFAVSNDDVCNCNKSQDRLISPVINAATLDELYLRFSAFQNGSGGQIAHVDVKAQGLPWYTLSEIPASSQWQTYSFKVPKAYLRTNFQLRFYYSDGGNYASGLAVDDIMLLTNSIEKFALTATSTIATDYEGSGQLYDQIPLRQARAARWLFGGWVDNSTEEEKNARIYVDIDGPVSFSDTSQSWLIASQSSKHITFDQSVTYAPYMKGSYMMESMLLTDSLDPSGDDDQIITSFNVSDSIYSRTPLSSNYQLGVWLQTGGDRYGAGYYFHQKDTVKAIHVNIHPASSDDARFRVKVFSYDTLSSSSFSTSSYEVGSENLGSVMRIELNRAVNAGRYLFVVEKEPGTGNLVIAANKQRVARNQNAMTRKSSQPWVESPYFPEFNLILNTVDETCSGHIQYTVLDESCPENNDGYISVNLENAPTPYTYTWSNGAGNVNTQSGLTPGDYSLTITDSIACQYQKTFTIDSADSLKMLPLTVLDSCNKTVGEIDLNISGGTPPFNILWNNQVGTSMKTELGAGAYQINLTDAENCILNKTINLDGTAALGIGLSLTLPDCLDSNGIINSVPFGTPPFTFNWSNGDTSQVLDSLVAGVFSLTIGDSIGCTSNEEIELSNNASLAVSTNATSEPNCYGEAAGEIDINVGGGQLPYTYEWSNSAITQDINGLNAGEYRVKVTDNDGCIVYHSTSISETSDPLRLDLNDRGNYCWRDSSGVLESITSGGQPNYSFVWSTGSTDEKIEDLHAGTFTLTVTDADGCTVVKESQVSDGLAFFSRIDSVIRDTSENFLFESKVFVSTFGGTPPYDFIWNDSIESEDLINVPFGPYVLWVTDQLGCKETLSYLLDYGPEGQNEIEEYPIVSIHPNPLTQRDLLKVKAESKIQSMTVFSIQGTQISHQSSGKYSDAISVNSLPPGCYQLRIKFPQGVVFKKFIVL